MSISKRPKFPRFPHILAGAAIAGASCFSAVAGTVIWSAGSITDTNWSDSANWLGGTAPGAGDDVKFFNLGATATVGVPNSYADAFGGTVASLQFGQTNLAQTVAISNGVTLNVNGTLFVGTSADPGVSTTNYTTITGAGGTLNLSSPTASLNLNQGQASLNGSRAFLDMSGLDTFTANIYNIGIASLNHFTADVAQRSAGTLYFAKTNVITLGSANTLANYLNNSTLTNSFEVVYASAANNGGVLSFVYLGMSNLFNVDSIGFGKSKASAGSAPLMAFNPAFLGSSPSAYFRGAAGGNSRVTWWALGDMADQGSSAQIAIGTNDFRGGTVDARIETLALGRDSTAAQRGGPYNLGVLTFDQGKIDVNTVYDGFQSLMSTNTTAIGGVISLGANATLIVNSNLNLGFTRTNIYAALKTFGVVRVFGGSVNANNITVGTSSVTNTISLSSATLIVSNTMATNASGLFVLNLTNSTLGLSVPANGSLRGLVQTLNTVGTTNTIQLDPTPVFLPSYPQQFALIKYTTWTGSNVFGFTNLPAWASGATLVSNAVNKSLDLLLPADPRPIFTAQPSPYSGAPGDNVTSSFAVTISAASVTPLGYQWYFVTNNVTNSLTDGTGPSGSSTLTGSTTANLQIANAQPGDNGNYFVVVTNQYGTNTSSQALLTISSSAIAPMVTGPAAVTGTNGVTTLIGNAVSGAPVPNLYWQYNGVPLADGVGPSGS
ncbi:MAG TPA: immunoglobulin domain-containing protein, partial [Verrucomicrobiae bacterium]